jgi:hypothetical protein
MARLDMAAVEILLHDIGNDITKLKLIKKEAIYNRVLEDLLAHAQALVAAVQAPLARGTLEMPRLEAPGVPVPEPLPVEESTVHRLPTASQAANDDFAEAPTLTGREV